MAAASLRILAVDDEELLLRMLTVFLQRLGHRVEPYLAGVRALEVFRERASEFDVVVLDLTLGDIDGEVVLREMLSSPDRVRILVCSGYPYEVAALPPAQQARVRFLAKPFLPAMLDEALQELTSTALL